MVNLPIATQSAISGLGIAYCFYSIVFRWTVIRNKYGRFGLYWWLIAVLSVFAITAYFAALAVWLIQWEILNSEANRALSGEHLTIERWP